MPTTYTTSPASVLPGQLVGRPVAYIPWPVCCTQGERFCGWARVANTWKQVPEVMAEKRCHEEKCGGGLIVAGSR